MYILSEKENVFKALSHTAIITYQSSICYASFMPELNKDWPVTL